MSRNPQQQRLFSIVEPVCTSAGYELVDLRFVLEQGGWVLRVCIDLPLDDTADRTAVPTDRVDLQDCEEMSRELSAVLDVEDPIPQAYSLEVSSPGIDRPLRTAAHFAYFAGSEVKIQLAHGVPADNTDVPRKNFRGVLAGVDESGEHLRIDVDGKRWELPIADVDHAKLVPDWDAVMHGGSGVGGGEGKPKPVKPGHRPSKKKPKPGSDASRNNHD